MYICKDCPISKNTCPKCKYCSRPSNDPNTDSSNPQSINEKNISSNTKRFNLNRAKHRIRILSSSDLKVLAQLVNSEAQKREHISKIKDKQSHGLAARAKQSKKRLKEFKKKESTD